MNKAEIISAMALESGLTKVECQKALEAFLSTVTTTLKSGDKVFLKGFGTFSVAERAARIGMNLTTRQKVEIPAKKNVKFKAGSDLVID